MKLFFALSLSIMLSACTTVVAPVATVPGTTIITSGSMNFIPATAKFYAWHPTASKVMMSESFDAEQLESNVRFAIGHMMAKNGYQLVALNQSPDVIVGFGMATESELRDAEIFKRTGLSVGLAAQGLDRSEFEKTSLMIALFNPVFEEASWKVLAQGVAQLDVDNDERTQRINKLIATMMSDIKKR